MSDKSSGNNDREINLMQSRRQARRFALQVLFSNEFLKEDILSVMGRIADSLEVEIPEFSRNLILKTAQNSPELDQIILMNLKGKKLQQLPTLDQVLLRMTISELLYFPNIPIEVTFNEALELTKEFISLRSSKFMNGVLDTIFTSLKKDNRINKDIYSKIHPTGK